MNSTLNPTIVEPDDALVARADERLAHAYQQIAHADEQLARVTEQISRLERDGAHDPSTGRRRPARERPALRGLIGVLLAAGIVAAAFVSQSSYGEVAKPIVARWAPQFIPASPWSLEKPASVAQPSRSAVQLAAAAPAQATPLAQAAPQEVAPTAAPVPAEVTELLQGLARDLANVAQGIEELKAAQAQMAGDNAKAVEQLKASQEQTTRLMARLSEQNLQPKTAAPSPRPAASAARKPAPTLPPEAGAQTRAAMPLQPKR